MLHTVVFVSKTLGGISLRKYYPVKLSMVYRLHKHTFKGDVLQTLRYKKYCVQHVNILDFAL